MPDFQSQFKLKGAFPAKKQWKNCYDVLVLKKNAFISQRRGAEQRLYTRIINRSVQVKKSWILSV